VWILGTEDPSDLGAPDHSVLELDIYKNESIIRTLSFHVLNETSLNEIPQIWQTWCFAIFDVVHPYAIGDLSWNGEQMSGQVPSLLAPTALAALASITKTPDM